MKADDLKGVVDALTERVNNTVKLLDELKTEQKQLQQAHNDHRREAEKENALLKREVEELKKGQDVRGQRVFTAVLALVSAVIGGVITYYVKKP